MRRFVGTFVAGDGAFPAYSISEDHGRIYVETRDVPNGVWSQYHPALTVREARVLQSVLAMAIRQAEGA